MKIVHDIDLTHHNSYQVHSVAKTGFFPANKAELIEILSSGNKFIIIGGGFNIILTKAYYTTPFVFIKDNYASFKINDDKIDVESGLSLPSLSGIAADNSIMGFETFCDIPGTVGGGILMNAGAGNQFLSDHLVSVEFFDRTTNSLVNLTKELCKFGYRDSIFHRDTNLIILSASFNATLGIQEQIRSEMELIKTARGERQPKEFPNAGSVFKRPEGKFVGTMIQELGLKGHAIGGAMISIKHAGFIVNTGNATGQDISNLIKFIQKKVFDNFNIHLETEQILI